MENTTDNYRRIPPRSKFNDEESTAVLRLIIEQERLLKTPANPVLNINSDKLKRLPPLNGKMLDSLDQFDPHRSQRKHRPGDDIVLSRPTLLKGKECRALEEPASLGGKPKVPDIYSTPKIARPRDRERPRASYGRVAPNRSGSTETNPRIRSRSTGECNELIFSATEDALERPTNPTPLENEDDFKNDQEFASRTSCSQSECYDSDEDKVNAERVYASYIN